MAAEPLISVVLPTYNRARLLHRSIGSVLAQNYANLEVIVSDDCSTDNTAEVVEAMGDPRIRYVRCPRNGGPAYARNRGVEQARGELIGFQDSDDEWLIDKLDRQLALLRESPPDVGMVCGSYLMRLLSGRLIAHQLPEKAQRGDFEDELLGGFAYTPPTWLFRRECLMETGLFDETLPNREDWDLIFKIRPRWKMRGVPEPVMIQYRTEDSVDRNFTSRVTSYQVILQRYAERFAKAPRLEAKQWYELGRAQRTLGRDQEARASVSRALRLRPLWPKAVGAWLALLFGRRWFEAAQRLYQKITGRK